MNGVFYFTSDSTAGIVPCRVYPDECRGSVHRSVHWSLTHPLFLKVKSFP